MTHDPRTSTRTSPRPRRTGLRLLPAVLAAASLSACVATAPTSGGGSGGSITDALRSLGSSVQAAGASMPAVAANLPLGGSGSSAGEALSLVQLLMQSIDKIDEPKEIEIGRNLAAVLLGAKPALKDARTQRYVNELGRWLALHSSRPQLPWLFVVLDDPGVNAFAAPGGFVFVTKGLLDRTFSEAELAGVLAHEIVHVEKKHHLQALSASARAGLATQLIGSQVRNNVEGVVATQLMNLGKNLYSKGLDRADEFEADALGVSLATRAGMDPFGLPTVLQTLSTVRPDDPAYLLALATHPPTGQRLASLQTAMGQQFDRYGAARQVPVRARVTQTSATPAATQPAKK
ncbi:M48 family metalloprotease [Hydrogenophaga defluvii]|uniref:M48 family metalloprotease n=1 Tax=Hydrogenophaga defluvii TaxID=249410 RepID=A0ABW2SHC4_9BURK